MRFVMLMLAWAALVVALPVWVLYVAARLVVVIVVVLMRRGKTHG